MMMVLKDLSREQLEKLISDLAKRWIAHDGLWFLAAEGKFDLETAIELDTLAWEKFTVIEAKRIMDFLQLPPNGGLKALATALDYRLYAFLNQQVTEWVDDKTLVFKMTNCRVQSARKRKGLPDFPCKSVGLVEYSGFAKTIDPRIKTRCIACPPDPHPEEYYCAWEFTIEDE
ncbi:MAG: hypothetical protein GX262_05815 [Clostridia bacterium]|nr:hypothetical protein [Clostridia bacterium]